MPLIDCRNLRKSYPASLPTGKKTIALDDVTFSVESRSVYGIIGPNGAGKSTLLKILMDFLRPDSGAAFIEGINTKKNLARKLVGYLPESPSLYIHLTPREHLQFVCKIAKRNSGESRDKIQTMLSKVKLLEFADVPIKRFSKGMTQRAAIAFSLINDPSILILDEPMSGLDPLGRQLVIDLIEEYRGKGTTILFSSHILSDVERICDKIAILNKGNILTEFSPESLPRSGVVADREGKTPLETFFLKKINEDRQ